MKHRIVLLFCALCLCTVSGLRAVTVDQYTAGPSTGSVGFWGESFITPSSSAFNNIVFTFLTTGGANFASGTGFLLSAEYLGTPAGLSSSTTGFLGQATASGNLYTFTSGITLNPNTTYYLYENISIPAGTIFGGGAGSPGRQFYYSATSAGNYGGSGGPANFRVTGNAVPEPSTTALLLSAGLAGLFVVRRAKRS